MKKLSSPKVPKIKLPTLKAPSVKDPYAKMMTPMQSGLIGALKQGKRVRASKFSS